MHRQVLEHRHTVQVVAKLRSHSGRSGHLGCGRRLAVGCLRVASAARGLTCLLRLGGNDCNCIGCQVMRLYRSFELVVAVRRLELAFLQMSGCERYFEAVRSHLVPAFTIHSIV